MTSLLPVRRFTRGLPAVALALLVLSLAPLVRAASHPAPVATVVAVEPTRVADLILLRGGFNAGLRQGMVCRLTREGTEIAEILLVDLRPSHSAALILNVAPRQSIRPGDLASIKILKT